MRRLGCRRSAGGRGAGAEKVGEKTVSARHQLGELPVEREGHINKRSFAAMRDQQAAALRILAGIGGLSERGVTGIPVIDEAVASFLEPSVEIG